MDWLRGLAALWVVFFHLNEPIKYVPNIYTNFCKLGWIGVPVFFVISGWCMAGISQRKPSAKAFLLARVLRIFPPFWGSLLVVALAVGVLVLVNGVNDVIELPKSLLSLLATISLTTTPISTVPTVNWSYWSLSYEIAFYFLISIGLLFTSIRERLDNYVLFLLVFSLVFSFFKLNPSLNILIFWAREFPLFAIGWFGQRHFSAQSSPLLSFISCTLFLVFIFLMPAHGLLTAAVGFFSVFALALGEVKRFPVVSGLRWLGDRSYSIYLIHVPLGCYLLLRLRGSFVTSNVSLHAVFDVLIVALVVLGSAIFFYWIEKPSHLFARQIAQSI